MYYVYEWYIIETNEIIYVGKGCKNRYKTRKHNHLFNEFIKRFNCESRIIKTFETEKEAFDYEYIRINELWSKGQCCCNIYKGGMGGTANWWTPELRAKYSKQNVMKNEEQRKRMSINNPMKNIKSKEKMIAKISKKIVYGDKIYNSIKELSQEVGLYDTAIQYWLKKGKGRNNIPCYYYIEEHVNQQPSHENSDKSIVEGSTTNE